MHGERHDGGTRPAPPASGDLAHLLEAETRFAGKLESARLQAARLLEEARAAAAADEARFGAEQEAAESELATRIEAEVRTRLSRMEQAARVRIALYSGIGPLEQATLVQLVLRRLLGSPAATAAHAPEASAPRTGTTPTAAESTP